MYTHRLYRSLARRLGVGRASFTGPWREDERIVRPHPWRVLRPGVRPVFFFVVRGFYDLTAHGERGVDLYVNRPFKHIHSLPGGDGEREIRVRWCAKTSSCLPKFERRPTRVPLAKCTCDSCSWRSVPAGACGRLAPAFRTRTSRDVSRRTFSTAAPNDERKTGRRAERGRPKRRGNSDR